MEAGARVAGLVLAAGLSRRMAGIDKLLAPIAGKPMVRTAVEAAVASRAQPIVVVTGHRAAAIQAALFPLPVVFAHNARYAEGMSTSLHTGLDAVPGDVHGALVLLADMPAVDTLIIDQLIEAFSKAGGTAIIVASAAGQRGNPVLWPARFFPMLRGSSGDVGGRSLLSAHAAAVVWVEIGPAAVLDVDTVEDLVAAGGKLPPDSQTRS